jgi:hypothetical protein
MTVKRFLADSETYLRRGDIVLSRSRTFWSWLIRTTTGSLFSHAAFVFLLPKEDERLDKTFLLESVSSGVGLANLQSYIEGKERSQIAIRRFEQPWADDDFMKHVGGIMLNHVHAGYDYSRAAKIGLSVLFGARLSWFKVAANAKTSMRKAVQKTRVSRRKWIPPQFICGGFIQYGFVEAQRRRGGNPADVVFLEGVAPDETDKLLATTPEDLARSHKLHWAYVIRNGWVYQVNSADDVRKVISSARL